MPVKIKKVLLKENPELQKFWSNLAEGKNVVLIYKDGTYKYLDLPKSTQKLNSIFNEFDDDSNIIAVLSSSRSTDIYTENLYPKAKDKSVDYVIKNYKKYFKPFGPIPKDMIKNGFPMMKKVKVP